MRINLLGGPGCGKSTMSAWLFSELKQKHYSVELITEYVKTWAHSKRNINEFDQVYIFSKQMQYEYRVIKSGVKNIITDSPIDLSAVYAKLYYENIKIDKHLIEIANQYEKKYPSFNILLNRGDKLYHREGRYQTREEAVNLDNLIEKHILSLQRDVRIVDYNDRDQILKLILEKIDK